MQGLFERSLERCIICPSSVVLHSSVFEKIGLFDPALAVCEDYDYWLRLLLHFDIGYVDEQLVEKHGGHDDQLSTYLGLIASVFNPRKSLQEKSRERSIKLRF